MALNTLVERKIDLYGCTVQHYDCSTCRLLYLPCVVFFVSDPMSWSVRDTTAWLCSQGLQQYQDRFAKNEISGMYIHT